MLKHATVNMARIMADLAKTGPLIFDLPAGPNAGVVDDIWQRPVEGGRFLMLGPGQSDPRGKTEVAPHATMYFVLNSPTLNVCFF